MVVKYGPYGKFLACPGFPECRNTKPHFEKVEITIPNVRRRSCLKENEKRKKILRMSENNPECEFMSWQKPSTVKCEKCGSYMIEKGKKLVCSSKECGFVCSMPEDAKEKETSGESVSK